MKIAAVRLPDTCNVLLQQYGLLAPEHNNSERVFIVADHYQPINSSFIVRKSIPRSGRNILWTFLIGGDLFFIVSYNNFYIS